MDLSPDLLLSILFIAIIVNTAVIVGLVVSNRSARRRQALATTGHASAVERTLATSYVDHSARAGWGEPAVVEPAVGDGADTASPALEAVAVAGTAVEVTEPTAIEPAAIEEPGPSAVAAAPEAPTATGRDALTGLLDATTFAQRVAVEEARVARYQRPATIVIVELEGLDRLIERLGHDAGDRVLAAVADTIRRLARGADHVARLGGGRFGVLLTETDEVAAINYVERVRRACDLWLESGAMAMRLAIGWAGTSGEPGLGEVQRVAVDRMYAELRRDERRATADEAATDEPTRLAS
jgi:diguanylate cyclase (GGDEF)-like protein